MATETETGTTAVQEDPQEENWMLLLDPVWKPEKENDAPPLGVVVGLWPVEPDGRIGKFRSNPDYLPSDENSPSDPLDAVLRLVLQGEGKIEQIQAMLRETLVDVAMNGDGRPLVMKSPDGIPCVLVSTGEPHRARLQSPDWLRTDVDGLVAQLADGVDVLFNPGGPASVRLTGDFIRGAAELSEDELDAIHQAYRAEQDPDGLRVVPWEVLEGEDPDGPPSTADSAATPSPDAKEATA
jgi:hypothetical protein